jgi:UDP-2,4-diacetamido-2,4,6-trideoxy-beta-L-altropyranose hydrolase
MLDNKIKLRKIKKGDSQLIWQWANAPSIRLASFSSNLIPWKTHVQWFNTKLQDSDCCYWLALNENHVPIGQVRFDLDKVNKEATISMSIAPEWQGCGYGKVLIETASELLFNQTSIHTINAFIKVENCKSIRTFEKAGFSKVDDRIIKGCTSSYYKKVSVKSQLINETN